MAHELEARRRYMARADVKEKRKTYDLKYQEAHPLTADQKSARLAYKRARYSRNCTRERERSWAAWGIDMSHWSYAKYQDMLNGQDNKCFACSAVIVATRAELTDASQVAQVETPRPIRVHSSFRPRVLAVALVTKLRPLLAMPEMWLCCGRKMRRKYLI